MTYPLHELILDIVVVLVVGVLYGAFCRRVFYWRGAYAFVQYSRFGLQMFAPIFTFFILRAYVGHANLTMDLRLESYRDIVLYTIGGMVGFFAADRPVEASRALPIRAAFRMTGEEHDEVVIVDPKPVRRKPKS